MPNLVPSVKAIPFKPERLNILPLLRGQELPAVIGQGQFWPETIAIIMASLGIVIPDARGAFFSLLPIEFLVHKSRWNSHAC